jgi:large subunit ribosomal protein L17
MRHRRRGRKLGRNPNHQRALLRNLASALILTERDAEDEPNEPKVRGRIITTLPKAKEVRPLVEKCITLAKKAHQYEEKAAELDSDAQRGTEAWMKWNQAIAPAVNLRRRVLRMIGNKEAVAILFEEVAPRFLDRQGGYTRVLRLAKPRLGDAGTQAVLEFVGTHDRVKTSSVMPTFETDDEASDDGTAMQEEESQVAVAEEEASDQEPAEEDTTSEEDATEEENSEDEKEEK